MDKVAILSTITAILTLIALAYWRLGRSVASNEASRGREAEQARHRRGRTGHGLALHNEADL